MDERTLQDVKKEAMGRFMRIPGVIGVGTYEDRIQVFIAEDDVRKELPKQVSGVVVEVICESGSTTINDNTKTNDVMAILRKHIENDPDLQDLLEEIKESKIPTITLNDNEFDAIVDEINQ